MKLFSKKLFSVGKKISQNESDKLKFLSQSFQGIEEVKVYGLKNFILETLLTIKDNSDYKSLKLSWTLLS